MWLVLLKTYFYRFTFPSSFSVVFVLFTSEVCIKVCMLESVYDGVTVSVCWNCEALCKCVFKSVLQVVVIVVINDIAIVVTVMS